MNAVRLIPRARIGIRTLLIEKVHVEVTGPHRIEGAGERAVGRWLQAFASSSRAPWIEHQLDLLSRGRPHAKGHASIAETGSEGGPPRPLNADTLIADQRSDCDLKPASAQDWASLLPYKRAAFSGQYRSCGCAVRLRRGGRLPNRRV